MYLKAKLLKKLALSPLLLLSVLSAGAWAQEAQRWQTNMTPGVTDLGQEIYDIHMFVFWLCVWTGVGVFGFMFYTMFAYRKQEGREPATFHHNTAAELAWTIIPAIILFAMAVPASKTLIKIYDTSEADLDVMVTGYQWKWKYEYLPGDLVKYKEEGVKVAFFSNLITPKEEKYNEEPKGEHYLLEVDNPLVIPVNKKTRFLITANDVIHAVWVPALAVKKDAIPGFINEAWTKPKQTGIFRGQCAELCGRDHGFMPVIVNVVEEQEFTEWLDAKQDEVIAFNAVYGETKPMEELYDLGKQVYDTKCAACHGGNGEGGVGKAIAGSPYASGDIADHIKVIADGVPGTAMQAFGAQINDLEMAAVVTYQRNAFGNNMGDIVQAIDVKNVKEGK